MRSTMDIPQVSSKDKEEGNSGVIERQGRREILSKEYNDNGADYVGSDVDTNNFSNREYECSEDLIELDWTIILPCSEKASHSDVFDKNECDDDDVYDSDKLHQPLESRDDEGNAKFSTYKSDEDFKFQSDMVFNNKEIVNEALKDYAMEIKKNDDN
ncbi:hypothetical protein KIW84_023993 [Lathyrus oleraceus]|uniref:Uncharacterized protein n=1 Tax=Pisum sativum TaxID=3888 RepID=A0A9D5B8T2_PEA|nr:hypothetical protein KIW84_023993 [Pisum sativum]